MKAFIQKICTQQEEGQVLLIVVLTMVVALTVGLGVVSRSIIQVKTAKDQGDSQKAFSAAEAGVQQALQSNGQITNRPLGNNSTISNVTVSTLTAAQLVLNNGTPLLQDEGTDIWLAPYQTPQSPWAGKSMKIYWGTNTGCNEAALEVILISQAGTGYAMQHYAYDPCASRIGTGNGNNFTLAPTGSGGTLGTTTFNYATTINVNNGILARVIPLYTNTIVGIAGYAQNNATGGSFAFPAQGTVITSTGASGSTTREIIYFQSYNQLPSELFDSLFVPQ